MGDRLQPPDPIPFPPERHEAVRRAVLAGIESPGRRRLAPRTLAVAIALSVIATSSIAGAFLLGPELDPATEIFPDERAAAIERLGADIPLPPGGSFDALVDRDHSEDERGLASTLAFNAWCQWTGSWLDATAAGDRPAQLAALEVMVEVPDWRELGAVDAGGVTSGLAGIATAASGGDVTTVAQHYRANCAGVDADRDARLGSGAAVQPVDAAPICAELARLLDEAADSLSDRETLLGLAVETAVSGPASLRPLADALADAAADPAGADIAALETQLTQTCQGET